MSPGSALASRHHASPGSSTMKSTREKSPEAQEPVDLQGAGLQRLGKRVGDVGREDFLGHPQLVLAFVVEELVLGHDLAHG